LTFLANNVAPIPCGWHLAGDKPPALRFSGIFKKTKLLLPNYTYPSAA